MGYDLGVDLGGTSVAAAMATGSRVEMVTLGDRTVAIPAVVYLGNNGTIVVGDAAARRAVTGSDRVGRELKRRLANPTPMRLGDRTYEVTALLGAILRDVVDRAEQGTGAGPDRVVLTHPAHWDAGRRELFGRIPRIAGLADVQMITEPEAAAAHHAASGRFAEGATIAVYDLGGGTFDATVLRNDAGRIEIVGRAEGIEQLGGGNFDEAILAHVNTATGGALTALDMRDPQNVATVARLRQECVAAKETLSVDDETTIAVFLPNRHAEVQLSRADFDAMIRTPVETTIRTLIRTLESAQVDPSELAAVLLVGGSTRIPLVAHMISDALGRPTVLDAHPKYAVALGAAGLATGPATATTEAPAEPAARSRRDGELVAAAVTAARVAHGGTVPQSAPGDLFLPSERRPAWPQPPDAEEISVFGGPQPPPLAPTGAPNRRTVIDNDEPDGRRDPYGDATPVGSSTPDLDRPVADTPDADAPDLDRHDPDRPDPDRPDPDRPDPDRPDPDRADPDGPDRDRAGGLPTAAIGIPVITTVTTPTAAAGRSPDPFLGVAPVALVNGRFNGVPPAPPVPPPLSDRPAGGAGRRRRRSLLTVAAVAVAALLFGLGYLIWGQLSTAAPPAAAGAGSAAPQGGAPTGAQPAAPQADAGPQPVAAVATPSVATSVQVGSTPGFVVVAPDGRTAMVANQAAGVVTVLDTGSNTVSATIPVTAGPPQYLSFSPDGRRAYVSIWDQARTVAAVGVLDTATNTIRTTIPVRTRPYLSAVTPDGKLLYVPNHDSGTVSVIDTGTEKVTTEIKVAPNPHWVEMSRDGTRAYTANHESNLVSVIDTSNNSILAEVPVELSPHSLAAHPTRPLVANVNYDSASVTMIDTNTDQVVATVPVGKNPQDITWAPDGRFAYVVNTSDSTVSVIDGDTAEVTATIPTGTAPTSVSVLPNGTEALISNRDDGTLTVLDTDG